MTETNRRSDCPISMSLDLWGDKWTLLIIRDLIFENKRTFGDFLESEEGIATNILASRLKLLKRAGIVTARPNPDNRSSSLISLTDKGIDLLPILVEIHMWADKHLPVTEDFRRKLELVKRDKAGFIADLSDRLRQRR